ncbi:hypothetical protein [Streptomyces sp. NBC_00503]|nr:hypothetical protein [Streptomyces sp. NBC_00503]WUD84554.1 hypothetical protein OG490_30565 [Streptomyces sp. NBC_00503]
MPLTPSGSDELRIPRFVFPWPAAIHPEVESAEVDTLEFAAAYGLAPDSL